VSNGQNKKALDPSVSKLTALKAYDPKMNLSTFELCSRYRSISESNGSSIPRLGSQCVRGFEKDWWGELNSARGRVG
jgi:hypothetical protein